MSAISLFSLCGAWQRLICVAKVWGVCLGMLILSTYSFAAAVSAEGAVYTFASPVEETRYHHLLEELRCPKCQNQSLAGSDAPIAQDLKQYVADAIQHGQTDQQIKADLIQKYGDFVSYRPPVRPATWILWFFPPVLLVGMGVFLFYRASRVKKHVMNITPPLDAQEQERLNRLLSDKDAAS